MTEEQRKAIVEVAAIVEFGRGFVPPLSYERACEEWKDVSGLAKRDFRWDAIAVLESVGYFKLVEAAEEYREACQALGVAVGSRRDEDEADRTIPYASRATTALERLFAALKEAV